MKKQKKLVGRRLMALILTVTMLLGMVPATAFGAEQNYELRILTFEDDEYKGDTNFAGEKNWSSLIDDKQSGGSLLYGGATVEENAYKWYDKNNTELKYVAPFNYDSYDFWGGGHAISHYNTADYETYCDYTTQLTVYNSAAEGGIKTTGGGYDGSDNFAVHYGYMDGSEYNFTEELPSLSFGDGKARVIDHMYVNNTCYQLYCYKGGNEFTSPVGEDDWVKLIATGYNGEKSVGSAEMVIVDGPDGIITDWTKWDLSGLGAVTKVEFNVDCSSDNGFGNSQPSYFAYDNVAVRFERETVEVTGVELSKTELALEVGGSETLTATVKPDNATDKTVTWESADETIAMVDENGEVTAVGEGETIITATVGGKTAQCVVTVTAAPTGAEGITISTGHTAEYMFDAYLSNIHIKDVSGTVTGENDSWNVLLSEKATSLTIELTASVIATPNRFFWVNDKVTDLALSESPTGVVTVEPVWKDNQAVITVGVGIAQKFNGTKYTITLGVTDQNRAPILTSGNKSSADLKVNQTYTLDVTKLFEDKDGDALTYIVNDDPIVDPDNYTFTSDSAGTKTLIFKAYDGKAYSEPYTVTLNVTENSIPVASAEDDKVTVDQYKTKTIDLSKLFTDADEDELSYFVDTGDGNKQALNGSKYSYDTSKAGTYTLKFYAKDVMDFSAAYTVTLTVDPIDRYTIATGETGGMPNNVGVVTEIYIDYQKAVDHHYIKYNDGTRTIAVQLDESVVDDATVEVNYLANDVNKGITITPESPLTLTDGKATAVLVTKGHNPFYTTEHTYTIYISNNANIAPTLKVDAAEVSVEKLASETFALDLTDIFTDANGDVLRYTLEVGEGEAQALESTEYSLTENALGEYKLVFTAEDVWGETVSYTVNLTVKNSDTTYSASVKIPQNVIPKFYATAGFDGENGDLLGEELTAVKGSTSNGYTTYTVAVPDNISRISVRGTDGSGTSWGGMSFETKPGMDAVSFRQVRGIINTKYSGSDVTSTGAAFQVKDKDGYYAVTGGNGTDENGVLLYRYLLAAYGLDIYYTFYSVPQGELDQVYGITIGENKAVVTGQGIVDSPLPLSIRGQYTITAPSDADVKMYRQNKYYNVSEVTKLSTTTKGNQTEHVFSVSKGAGNLSYRVSKEGEITKAGYVDGNSEGIVVNWDNDDRGPQFRQEYDTKTLYGSRGDDSVMVNVNGQNHLTLDNGETFRLKAYRIWEIINSDTANKMIEPDFTCKVLAGSDVVDVTPVTDVCTGNAGNNWFDIRAKSNGIAILEIGYNAIEILSGNGGGGGGSETLDKFTFNACDPSRTAMVVVQVGGSPIDVDFGIQSYSKIGSESAEWDVEFDTLYFTGDSGEITFVPDIDDIEEVAVSGDQGKSWTTLTTSGGVYTAPIVSGNNILKVVTAEGTDYQVVRGDKVAVEYTEISGDNDGKIEAGEKIRVELKGVHNPIGKMSGVYNPGYQAGQHLNYKWEVTNRRVSTPVNYQYNFVGNAYVEVTIPSDATDQEELTLDEGYINFNVIGGMPGVHRSIPDEGLNGAVGTGGSSHIRSILPDITVTVGGEAELPDTETGDEGGSEEETPLPEEKPETNDYGLSVDEIKGYVYVSFEDNGIRKEDELSQIESKYKKPLGTIISKTKVPFKAYDTIASVTLRLLEAKGIEAEYDGNEYSSFYLSSIGDFKVGNKTYDSFGEFDAGGDSGWMITWDDWFINKGASEFTVKNGDYVRWQYTCQLGADIGDDYFEREDSATDTTTKEEEQKPSASLTPEASTNSKGEASVEIKKDELASAVEEATKDNTAGTVVIAPEIKGDASKVTVEMPKEAVDSMATSGKTDLTVKTDIATVTLPAETLKELPTDGKTVSVAVEAVKGDETAEAGSTAAADKIVVEVAVDNKAVDKIGSGVVASIPAKEVSATSVLVIVDAEGNETIVKKSAVADGEITALLEGSCTVVVKDNKKEFTDTEGHWGKSAAEFASSRELFNGVGNGKFGMNTTMNRAMMATVFYNLENGPDHDGEHDFHDVQEGKYYAKPVAWAAESGVLSGYSDGSFRADAPVTREQLAVMLWNYSGKPSGIKALDHSDAGNISNYAKEAMQWAVENGVMSGRANGQLDPKGAATRAEVAQMFKNYIEKVVL